MSTTYRKLTREEIEVLKSQGCASSGWDCIEVASDFVPGTVRNVRFGKNVKIGSSGVLAPDKDNISRHSGIYNAEISDCTVGDNVLISNVGSYIAHCDIGNNVIIENTGKVVCTGDSLFGNGFGVKAVNENGGRKIPVFDKLSAQTAYIATMYRHRPGLTGALNKIIYGYSEGVRSSRCTIGDGASITGCGTLRNVRIGEYAILESAAELDNGTVVSTEEQPVYIGAGVTASNFICGKGSVISGNVSIDSCYIGEACRLINGFSSTHSLFFANCDCGAGEFSSVFAGPFTVSHHKSSLLIAGYFLFCNAGSGSSQSNHLFKTGPVHQGIHERGCKLGANAYITLPAREGAFSSVLGRHDSHHDTKDLPYSYIIEEDGHSYIHPGANICSYGTERDFSKWVSRDERGKNPLDRINFEEFNPYTGGKLKKAQEICSSLSAKEGIETHTYKRVKIKTNMMKRGLKLYETALNATVGDILEKGFSAAETYCPQWADVSGMFMPVSVLERLVCKIEYGKIKDIDGIEKVFDGFFEDYQNHAYAWALGTLEEMLGSKPEHEDIEAAIAKGRESKEVISKTRAEDAGRDSSLVMQTGYGIDSDDPAIRNADFKTVHEP